MSGGVHNTRDGAVSETCPPDFMALIPEGPTKSVLAYCFDTLGLSTEQTASVLYSSTRLAQSIDVILRGGVEDFTASQHEE